MPVDSRLCIYGNHTQLLAFFEGLLLRPGGWERLYPNPIITIKNHVLTNPHVREGFMEPWVESYTNYCRRLQADPLDEEVFWKWWDIPWEALGDAIWDVLQESAVEQYEAAEGGAADLD